MAAGPAQTPAPASPPTEIQPRNLLAYGNESRFWIARVQSVTGDGKAYEQTAILVRGGFGDAWTPLSPIFGRVVGMASSSGELLLVLDNGQWQIADADGARAGPPTLPDSSMLAIADDAESVWAIASAAAPIPSSNPATEPATNPSLPAIEPPRQRLLISRFKDGRWVDFQELPPDVAAALPPQMRDGASQLSLAVVNELPLIAWRAPDGSVSVIRLTRDHLWTPPLHFAFAKKLTNFKLVVVEDRPVLWVTTAVVASSGATRPSEPISAGELLSGEHFSTATPLRISGSLPSRVGSQTIAFAFGRLRWLALADDKPFVEQAYDLDGEPVAELAPVAGVKPQTIQLAPWLGAAAALVLLAALAAIRQRRPVPLTPSGGGAEVRLSLAPLGVRFAAGLVDLLPFFAVAAIVHPAGTQSLFATVDEKTVQNLSALATLTYILHCLIAEMICGQSIGKMLFHLRVVTVGGNKPTPLALLVRNALRILDVSLLFVPLFLVLLLPLRQRAGDVAARTIVISVPDVPNVDGDDQDSI